MAILNVAELLDVLSSWLAQANMHHDKRQEGASLIRKRHHPSTIVRPYAQTYCRVLGEGVFSFARYPCTRTVECWHCLLVLVWPAAVRPR